MYEQRNGNTINTESWGAKCYHYHHDHDRSRLGIMEGPESRSRLRPGFR